MDETYESGYDPKYGYNRNAFKHKTLPQAVIGMTVKLIAMPIGLVSEAIHEHNEKKKQQKSLPGGESKTADDGSDDNVYVHLPPDQAEHLVKTGQAVPAEGAEATHELVHEHDHAVAQGYLDIDEADWTLDEAVSDDEDGKLGTTPPPAVVSRLHGSSSEKQSGPKAKLPFPVVLPQRRPGTKTRGFVRAYAPVLQDCGIDQTSFLWFLKDFHEHAQANPVFEVVRIATAVAGLYPDPIVGLSVLAVQIAAGIGQEVQERWRTNKFLDQANRDIFIPKGLFAMVVTYKQGQGDEAVVSRTTADLSATAVAKYDPRPDPQAEEHTQPFKQKMQERLRVSSAQTHERDMPVMCAPLVYPRLDAAQDAHPQGASIGDSIKTKSKDSSQFVSSYFDRRAQAKFAVQHPGATLTAQADPNATKFRSRFADPNNQTNMHFFTLVTGGKFKAEPLGAKRRWEAAKRKEAERQARGLKEKPKKRMLQEDVLYLQIVNMPTEKELEQARRQLSEAKIKS